MQSTPERIRSTPAAAGDEPRCIVITFGWALGTPGGVARHIQELAAALAGEGVRVVLVCVSAANYASFPRPVIDDALLGFDHEERLAPLGVEVVRVAPHPLHWMLDGKPLRRALERILVGRRVDAVLSFFNEAAWLPSFLRERGITFGFIATWLSYRMALAPARQGKGLRGLLMRRANRRFIVEPYREAEVLFANSEFTKSELIEVVGCAPERIHVTYLGVRPDFARLPRAPREAVRRLLFFGRLVPEKGIADALEALGRLAAEGRRDWTFRIFGSGAAERVRELAREHGIEALVEVAPHLDDAGLFRELEAADLAVLPSHSESFGLAIAEAQAAGLAVVAYDAGSVPEVVEAGRTAWLAPKCDIGRLTDDLRAALSDPAETYARGLAGRERMARLFTWSQTARRVLDGLPARAPRT